MTPFMLDERWCNIGHMKSGLPLLDCLMSSVAFTLHNFYLMLDELPADVLGIIVEFGGFLTAIKLIKCCAGETLFGWHRSFSALRDVLDQPSSWRRLCDCLWSPHLQNAELYRHDYKALLRDL